MNLVHQDLDIVDLYTKIRTNPQYLDVPRELPFVESPLHTAASEGRTGLALEILRLRPSLGNKLNLDGLSPLHLALGNGRINTVRRLVKHDPELIRVQGREGITLLHYAVERNEIDLLIYFLLLCPLSIYDLTVRDETAVHIAVRNNNLRAFRVLFGWATRTNNTTVLRWRNEQGNTLMHLAALINQPTVMRSLIGYVDVNKMNLDGMTALDILQPENFENFEARRILRRTGARRGLTLVYDATSCENYLTSKMTIIEVLFQFGAYLEYGLSGNMRNAILVVVVLVATATFQAILTPPAFVISHNDTIPVFPNITSVYNDTTSTNSTRTYFKRLEKLSAIYNAFAFGLAMGMCIILTLNPFQLFPVLSLAAFLGSYAALAYGIYPVTEALIISAAVLSLSILPILIILPWKTILSNGLIKGDNYYQYNLDEVKYLVFGGTFMNQGPILTSMAKRKAPR